MQWLTAAFSPELVAVSQPLTEVLTRTYACVEAPITISSGRGVAGFIIRRRTVERLAIYAMMLSNATYAFGEHLRSGDRSRSAISVNPGGCVDEKIGM